MGRLYTIDPSDRFLPTLAARVLDGTLWPNGKRPSDPFALADVTVFLPTRRAARALAEAFLSAAPGPATVLPAITALGGAADDEEAGPPVIGATDARLLLAKLIERGFAEARLPEGLATGVASSLADRVRLADDLLSLMDQVETQEADWAQLPDLVPLDDLAAHWQTTTDFLRVATAAWPQALATLGKVSAATARRAEADRASRAVANARGPMIVAGSTGSIPATRRLIAAIAQSPLGAVVLPGYDRKATPADWAALATASDRYGHWQFGLRQLVEAIDAGALAAATPPRHGGTGSAAAAVPPHDDAGSTAGAAPPHCDPGSAVDTARADGDPGSTAPGAALQRGDVGGGDPVRRARPGAAVGPAGGVARLAGVGAGVRPDRTALFTAALRPACATDRWLADRAALDGAAAFEGLTLVEAADDREEAMAAAVALREAVEAGGTAALVTPHPPLARRVAIALARWQVAVDDSAGEPLTGTPAGVLARLLAAAARGGAADWLALIKLPAAAFGLDGPVRAAAAAVAETHLRGPPTTLAALWHVMRARGGAAARYAERVAPHLDALGEDGALAETAVRHAGAFEAAIAGGAEPAGTLGVRTLLAELAVHVDTAGGADYPAALDALLAGIVVRGAPKDGAVRILGPLEARLQSVDHVVLGGLNEGQWPAAPDESPFLSRGMMHAFGIELPERRIGLSAHDFVLAAHAPFVTLTRAARVGNDPAIASRWWQRLATFAGSAADAARRRGRRLVSLAAMAEARPAIPPAERPEPCPPVALRPVSISVTDVPRWVNDPYELYAKRILRLRPLDPLEANPDAMERGTLFHQVLQLATDAGVTDADEMMRIAEQALAELDHAPAQQALWRARLAHLAPAFTRHLAEREGVVATVTEAQASADLCGVTLNGRIDRLDQCADGTFVLIDYKTGSVPDKGTVTRLREPQLPLLAALAEAGGAGVAAPGGAVRVSAAHYVEIGKREPVAVKTRLEGDLFAEVVANTCAALSAHAMRFRDPATPYRSRARLRPDGSRPGDYDHLARVAEWWS